MKMQGRIKSLTWSAGMAGALLMSTAPALAHVSTKRDTTNLKNTFATADAVIHGVVADVQYRMSAKQGERGESLPHTFVTYQIRGPLLGKVPGQTITLRFIGGPDGSGRFLTVKGVPLFQKGHEDVLFIKGNGRVGCPLVNCEDGRFRIHEGRVYNSRALPVVAVERDVVHTGVTPEPMLQKYTFPTPSFDNLMKRPEVAEKAKGDTAELKRRYETEAPKQLEYTLTTAPPAQEGDKGPDAPTPSATAPATDAAAASNRPPLAAEAFIKTLRGMAQQTAKRPDQVAASVNPDKPFSVRLPRVAAPKTPPTAAPARTVEKPEERRERETLEQQDFDPVIKK